VERRGPSGTRRGTRGKRMRGESSVPLFLFRPGGAKEILGLTRLLRMHRARNCPLTPAPSPSVGRGERWATPRATAIPPPRRGGCVETRTFHGLRDAESGVAPPVATFRGPVGAEEVGRQRRSPRRPGCGRVSAQRGTRPRNRVAVPPASSSAWPVTATWSRNVRV